MPKLDDKTTTTPVVDKEVVKFPVDKPAHITVWSRNNNVAASWKSNKPRVYFFILGMSDYWIELSVLRRYYQTIIEAGYEICVVSAQPKSEQEVALFLPGKDKYDKQYEEGIKVEREKLPFIFISDEKFELKPMLEKLGTQLKMKPTFDFLKKEYFNSATMFVAADGTVTSVISFEVPPVSDSTLAQLKTNAVRHVIQAVNHAREYRELATPAAGPTSASTYLLTGSDAKAAGAQPAVTTQTAAAPPPSQAPAEAPKFH